jgi:succinate dehydrogenase/fumarate reductase-like Fe-S protein
LTQIENKASVAVNRTAFTAEAQRVAEEKSKSLLTALNCVLCVLCASAANDFSIIKNA